MSVELQMVVFLLIASTVWALAHGYVASRLIWPLDLERRRRRWLWWVAFALWSLAPLAMIGERNLGADGGWWTPIRWVGYSYMGLFTIVFLFVAARDLVYLAGRFVQAARRRLSADAAAADPERRHFLLNATNAGLLGVSGVLTSWGIVEAQRLAEVVEVDVPVRGLPPALDGYRIAQLSDVHVGPMLKGDWLEEVVDRVNETDADLVAVTGDLIDGFVAELTDHVAPLGRLRARDGLFFVTGNHEYYWNVDEWCEEVRRLGLSVLNNEHRVVERDGASILVAGVTDYRADRYAPEHASDPAKAREGAPECDFELLLAHQPRSVVAAAAAGFDLQLSGHTHGGQFYPFALLAGLAHPYLAGLHRHDDRLWIYVSCGTGYWGPPQRAGVPAEITLLRLVAA